MSLVSTGVVVYRDVTGMAAVTETVKTEPTRTAEAELRRLLGIREAVLVKIHPYFAVGQTLAAMEAPSFGSIGGHAAARDGLNYFMRELMFDWKIPLLIVPPMTLKKFTIKGNAKKEEMKLAVFKRWGFEADGNDIIDAYALCRLAEVWQAGDEQLRKKIEVIGF